MRPTTDLVKDSKLKTEYRDGITQHTILTSDRRNGHRKIKREQRWQRVGGILGEGAFGTVWKEVLVGGQESDVKDRAVKRIRKRTGTSTLVDYSRELETIAKFSRGQSISKLLIYEIPLRIYTWLALLYGLIDSQYKSFFVESYGWFESRDHVFITMEYFEHGDLQEYMNTAGRMSEDDARSITYQILEGLYQMHDNGFAHRDLKPSNVLVRRTKDHEEGWWVKIGDFGISKRAEEGMTALRTIAGTEGFLAPEVLLKKGSLFLEEAAISKMLMNEREYTFAVDIWALGEIACRMMCGSQPFLTDLAAYANARSEFPTSKLQDSMMTAKGIQIVQGLMKPFPRNRLTASDALAHVWFDEFRDGSSQSSGELESVVENYEILSDLNSPTFRVGTSGTSIVDASESVPWTDLDVTLTLRPTGGKPFPFHTGSTSPLNEQIDRETATDMVSIQAIDKKETPSSDEAFIIIVGLPSDDEQNITPEIQPAILSPQSATQPEAANIPSAKLEPEPKSACVDDEQALPATQKTGDRYPPSSAYPTTPFSSGEITATTLLLGMGANANEEQPEVGTHHRGLLGRSASERKEKIPYIALPYPRGKSEERKKKTPYIALPYPRGKSEERKERTFHIALPYPRDSQKTDPKKKKRGQKDATIVVRSKHRNTPRPPISKSVKKPEAYEANALGEPEALGKDAWKDERTVSSLGKTTDKDEWAIPSQGRMTDRNKNDPLDLINEVTPDRSQDQKASDHEDSLDESMRDPRDMLARLAIPYDTAAKPRWTCSLTVAEWGLPSHAHTSNVTELELFEIDWVYASC
ncbi:calcium/calmodulin-dependent protein kinase type 1B [Paraphaeosphaeria sporulosa]